LWRFYCPGVADLTKQRLEELQRREKRASLAISFILFFLGVGVIITAANDLNQGQQENDVELVGLTVFLSLVSIVIFGTLCVI
jgi:divalent metal cation (Fe/Co/Zn/Cd) transporter